MLCYNFVISASSLNISNIQSFQIFQIYNQTGHSFKYYIHNLTLFTFLPQPAVPVLQFWNWYWTDERLWSTPLSWRLRHPRRRTLQGWSASLSGHTLRPGDTQPPSQSTINNTSVDGHLASFGFQTFKVFRLLKGLHNILRSFTNKTVYVTHSLFLHFIDI